MTSAAQRGRFSPGSALAVAVVAGLLLGLVALCCCAGEHPIARAAGHTSVTLSDPGTDRPADAGRSADGCDRRAGHPDAIVASVAAGTRDVVAVVTPGPARTADAAARTPAGAGGAPARAPAARLLCIMRT